MNIINGAGQYTDLSKIYSDLELHKSTYQQIEGTLENLKGLRGKEGITKAAKGFESLFVLRMLQEMRKTVPKNSMFGDSFAIDIYMSMFDEKLANRISESGQFGLSSMLIEYLDNKYNSPMFKAGDIKDPAGIATKLRDGADPLSKYIRKRLSFETVKLLDSYNEAYPPTDELLQALINDLNLLLVGESIYNEDRFMDVNLSNEVKELVKDHPFGKNLTHLNRLLLEEAFEHELVKLNEPKASNDINTEKSSNVKPESKPLINDSKAKEHSIGDSVNRFLSIVNEAAKEYKLDPDLIKAVIAQESGGKPQAVSKSGAKGLMQLMDKTAAGLDVKNIFDPHENIFAGVRYLKELLIKHDGDLLLALAAYNAGPGAVELYNGIPPYSETNNFIQKVIELQKQFRSGEQI